jgi:hypothetical protein
MHGMVLGSHLADSRELPGFALAPSGARVMPHANGDSRPRATPRIV